MNKEMPKLIDGEVVYNTSKITPEIQAWIDSAKAMQARIEAKFPNGKYGLDTTGSQTITILIGRCMALCGVLIQDRDYFLGKYAPYFWSDTRVKFYMVLNGRIQHVEIDITPYV